jgi:hypothetical protein
MSVHLNFQMYRKIANSFYKIILYLKTEEINLLWLAFGSTLQQFKSLCFYLFPLHN